MQETLLILIGLYLTQNIMKGVTHHYEEKIASYYAYASTLLSDIDEKKKLVLPSPYPVTRWARATSNFAALAIPASLASIGVIFVTNAEFMFDGIYYLYRYIVAFNLLIWLLPVVSYVAMRLYFQRMVTKVRTIQKYELERSYERVQDVLDRIKSDPPIVKSGTTLSDANAQSEAEAGGPKDE